MLILPRQARDKHRENSQKGTVFQSRTNSVPVPMRQGLFFLENASDIQITNCVIRSAASSGIWLNHAVSGVVIQGNWIEEIGYCGVFMCLLRPTLVYQPKDLNRDWSPRFSTLRDKNGWI